MRNLKGKVKIPGIIGIVVWTLGTFANCKETFGSIGLLQALIVYLLGAVLFYFIGIFISHFVNSKFKSKYNTQKNYVNSSSSKMEGPESYYPQIENVGILRLEKKCLERKIDTIFITTSNKCPECKSYNRKIYSLYGWNNEYPKLPPALYNQKCPFCGVSIGAVMFFPDINTK